MSREAEQFELNAFLPYMLNQAAEAVSQSFQEQYRKDYGLTRTQWRIMAHLNAASSLTAREICQRSHEDKVSVSRGVAALEGRGWLARAASTRDRRYEVLSLTEAGSDVVSQLAVRAGHFERELAERVGVKTVARLRSVLEEVLPMLERAGRS